jgi:hypothetical protein
VVTEAEIIIDNDVILDGEGNLTVDGNEDHRVLSVPEGVTAELHGFAVTGGRSTPSSYPDAGGGITNLGTLTVTHSTVSGNSDGGIGQHGDGPTLTLTDSTVSGNSGSGIFQLGDGPTLTLINSTVSGNSGDSGAGIYSLGGEMTLISSTVSRNSAKYGGGGIRQNSGTLTLMNSTVSGNSAGSGSVPFPYGSSGGGIAAEGVTVTLTNSTVSGNSAEQWGGGFFCQGWLTLINSTVSGNSAGVQGGGIWSDRCRLTLINSTVSGNSAGSGAGIFDHLGSGTLTLTSSLVDNDCVDATAISGGYNIESPGDTCGFDHGTDLVNITEGQLDLGPLQDNRGPTETHALGAGSVAIDHIPVIDCELDEDQRGQPRPETGGTMCDVGAFEVQP